MSDRPPAAELVRSGTGYLTRGHLAELGLGRRAIDGVFRAADVIVWPGYSRPMVKVEDFLRIERERTFGRGRVR